LALKGKICPGFAKSLLFAFSLLAAFIVVNLSLAETPVVTPFFASIEIVKGVW